MKKLFLLDGHALVYRAHYAFITRPLMNSKGWNVSCISGFTRVLLDVLKREKPTHIAVSFDLPTPTFRHIEFPEYKANRDSQPEDISFGLPYIKQILRGMRIPIVTADGYEADDVIGTLAKKAEKEGFQVFMMTPDKDYAQLVSPNVFLYKPAKSGNDAEVWGEKEVLEHWNIRRVEQVIDMLGLQGDAVDNIPGIPGIGPKTAAILLEKYDSVENLITHAHELKGKQQESVQKFAEQGLLSKHLARIALDVPVEFDANTYALQEYDKEALMSVFKDLEFKSIANEILNSQKPDETRQVIIAAASKIGVQGDLFNSITGEDAVKEQNAELVRATVEFNIENTPHNYVLVDTAEKCTDLVAKLLTASVVAFDSETTSIEPTQADIVGLSFSMQAGEAYYVPVPENRDAALALLEIFKPFFAAENVKKVGQNLKYDLIVLKNYGIEVAGIYFDTMLAHYLLAPELRHNMNFMSETYLRYSPISIETLIGKGKNQGSMRDVPVEKVTDYAAEDADITFRLYEYLKAGLDTEGWASKLLFDLEIPLMQVLVDIEKEGVRVNPDFLNAYSVELDKKIKALEEKVYELAGAKFNIASTKQVGEMLFDTLKIPYRWKKSGKSGQYVTDEETLSELALNYPICQAILDFRGTAKLKSTYVDALPKLINPRTGRIHSSFNQALAATGRLSSQNPNLQNIPIRTEEGRHIRKAFIPRDDNHVLISADYSQIELRLIAEIANETAMLEAFQNQVDIHLATAAKVYGTPLSDVTPTQRRNAKTVNFSIIYGAGAQNLSQQLSIPRTEAKALIEAYFAQYKGLKHYMQSVVEECRKNGYVSTLLGRRRKLRDIDSRNQLARTNAERVAVNTPIQGSAADMIKIAMINIHKTLKDKGLQTKMILQVHDELIFDVPKSEVEIVKPIIEEGMRTAMSNLRVPIEVGIGVGDNWLEAH